MQDKAALGKRYVCFECSTKFYDLNKPVAACPKCGADQANAPQPDARVTVMSKYKASAKPVARDADGDDEDFDLDDEADFGDEDDDEGGGGDDFDDDEEEEQVEDED